MPARKPRRLCCKWVVGHQPAGEGRNFVPVNVRCVALTVWLQVTKQYLETNLYRFGLHSALAFRADWIGE